MNLVTEDQVYRKIVVGDYKTAIIYDRHFNNIPNNLAYFERYDCESIEDLDRCMKEFFDQYTGLFSIVLKKSKGGNLQTSCLCRVNIQPKQQQLQGGIAQAQPSFDPVAEREKWMAEFKKDMTIEMLQAQNAMHINRLQELDTTSGRMGLMIENFFMAKMGKAAPMFQQNGTLNGTVEIQNEDDGEVSDEDLGKALIAIKDKFGASNLVKIQEKIESGDATIDMIINSLNNG